MTHAAIYVGNNKIVEARLGEGVTLKHVDDALQGKSFVALRPQLAPSTRKNAAEFAKKQVGKAYDDIGLAMAAVGAFLPESAAKLLDTGARRDRESWVCANLVTAAYAKARLTTLRGILAPADLRTSPKMTHVKTVVVDPEHMSDVSLGRLSGVAKVATLSDKLAEIEYHGKTFPGYNQPVKSDSADKKMMVLAKKGDEVRLIHFGQKGYQHNYSPEAKQNYLTRSAGIRNKSGQLTKDDPFSPNYWARKVLWPKGETGHGHNGPVNTEVRMQRKEAGLFMKEPSITQPGFMGNLTRATASLGLNSRAQQAQFEAARKSGALTRMGGLPRTAPPAPKMASWNRTRDPDYLHRLAMDVAHNGDPSVFGVHTEKKASLRSFLEKEANAVTSLAQRLHGHEAALAGGLIGAAGGAAGGHVSTNDPKNKKRNMVLGGLAGGVAGSIGAAKARKHLRAEGLLNGLHEQLTNLRQRGVDLISVHGPEDIRSKYTSKELADIAATARKRYGFKTASVPATAPGNTLLASLIERKEDEKLAAALKLAENAPPANKKWSWKGFREGIRDEGIPMAGMVGGAYLGNHLLPGGSGAVYGSGIGYGGGALANLGLEHVLHKKQQAKTASDSSPSSFIPGAIGATLGAGVAGGMTKEEKNKGRNMLAGSAIGYGLADAGMLARELIKKRMAK